MDAKLQILSYIYKDVSVNLTKFERKHRFRYVV